MDNKHFIKLLLDKTGQNTSEAEKFLKELALLFNEGIANDNFVKVRGLGIFKVVLVKERESVHVNTGERIVIPSHNKLSFIPEKKLRDTINKPFALFEVIETQENDNGLMSITTSETEEAEETGEAINNYELRITKQRSAVANYETGDTGEIGDRLPPPPPLPIEEKPLPPPPPLIKEELPPPPPKPVKEKQLRHMSSVPLSQKQSNQDKKEQKKSKGSSTTTLLWILFILLFIFVASAIYYFFFYNRWDDTFDAKLSTRILGNELSMPGDTILSDNVLNENQALKDTLTLVQSEAGIDTTKRVTALTAEPVPVPAAATPTPRQEPATRPTTATATTNTPQTTASSTNNNNVLARVRIEPGQRLTLIAEQYYGDKVFWVYIYEYNKATIGSNPNLVRTGMEILVPAKALYGIDANNAASISKATDIQRQIMGGN